MKRTRLATVAWTAAVVALAASASGCSSGGGSSSSSSSSSSSAKPSGSASVGAQAVVKTATSGKLGTILVDAKGRTLYLFEADKAGKSECNGVCATAWPPYLGGDTPQAGTGVTGALLGTTIRKGGGVQVTYGGHPLYRYAGDSKPGDVTGQGLDQFGAKWFVMGVAGNKIDID